MNKKCDRERMFVGPLFGDHTTVGGPLFWGPLSTFSEQTDGPRPLVSKLGKISHEKECFLSASEHPWSSMPFSCIELVFRAQKLQVLISNHQLVEAELNKGVMDRGGGGGGDGKGLIRLAGRSNPLRFASPLNFSSELFKNWIVFLNISKLLQRTALLQGPGEVIFQKEILTMMTMGGLFINDVIIFWGYRPCLGGIKLAGSVKWWVNISFTFQSFHWVALLSFSIIFNSRVCVKANWLTSSNWIIRRLTSADNPAKEHFWKIPFWKNYISKSNFCQGALSKKTF